MLGVGLVLSSLSSSSQSERDRVHVSLMLDRLLQTLQDSSSMSRMLQEVNHVELSGSQTPGVDEGVRELVKKELFKKKKV